MFFWNGGATTKVWLWTDFFFKLNFNGMLPAGLVGMVYPSPLLFTVYP